VGDAEWAKRRDVCRGEEGERRRGGDGEWEVSRKVKEKEWGWGSVVAGERFELVHHS
jgi:hypothetical protein